MNGYLRFVFLPVIFLVVTSLSAADTVVDGTILPFFEALKAGNVKGIEAHLGEPLSTEVKVLLRNNRDYPRFLRQHYEGAYCDVTKVKRLPGGEVIVDLGISFPGRETEYVRLRVVGKASGDWKIVEQQRTFD